MANAVVTRKEFDRIKDIDVKLGILFDTEMKTLKLLKGKRLDLKAFAGGIVGGVGTILIKFGIWR